MRVCVVGDLVPVLVLVDTVVRVVCPPLPAVCVFVTVLVLTVVVAVVVLVVVGELEP